jgi:hypothetical protein
MSAVEKEKLIDLLEQQIHDTYEGTPPDVPHDLFQFQISTWEINASPNVQVDPKSGVAAIVYTDKTHKATHFNDPSTIQMVLHDLLFIKEKFKW